MNKLFSRLTLAFLLSASCFLVSGCTNDEPTGGDSSAASSSESGSSAGEMEKPAGGSDSKPAGGGSGSK